MKVVFYCQEEAPANISNYLDIGASGTVSALILASHSLAGLGHDVIVLNRSDSGWFFGTRYLHTRSAEEALAHLSEIGEADVFIANGWAAQIFLEHEVNARRKVYWVHNFVDQAPFESAIIKGRMDYVFCISLNQFGTWFRSPILHRVTQIYNGVDIGLVDDVKDHREREKKIMFIGAPRESKGFHDALRVFDSFSRRNAGYTLYVAGGADLHGSAGPLSANHIFEKEFEDTHLRDLLYDRSGRVRSDVVLLGRVSRVEVLRHLATARVALQNPSWSSEAEVHSVACLEAQAMGVPVVSTFRGGQPEVVRDGRSGILVKRRGDIHLVRAMERITMDVDYGSALSVAASEHVRAHFNLAKVGADWESAIQTVSEGRGFCGNRMRAVNVKVRNKLNLYFSGFLPG